MIVYTGKKKPVELMPLETEVIRDRATRTLAVAVRGVQPKIDPHNTSALVARAARAFFEIGPSRSARAAVESPPEGPPPVAFRESETGLIHVVYREIVVRFRSDVAKATRESLLAKHGFKVRRVNPFFRDQVIVYHPDRKFSGEALVNISNEWAETDEVEFSSPNFVSQYRRHALPAIRSEQWHLRNKGGGGAKKGEDVNVLEAWKVTTGKRSVIVAVLDDGVDIDHPNLKGNIWKNPKKSAKDKYGRDFYLPDDHPDHFNPRPKQFQSPYDDVEINDIHGTCCAGVIAAAGRGAVGIAPRCRFLAVKVFHGNSLVPDERVADALRYAGTIADVLSCSWGGGEASADVQQALEDLGSARGGRGVAVFCAAGNDRRPVDFPASDPNAIAVSASTDQAKRAGYSNFGAEVAMCAPSNGGVRDIFTTDVSLPNRGFNIGLAAKGGKDGLHANDFGGTSSATPLAAGVAALVLSVDPTIDRQALRDLLKKSADRIGTGYDTNGHSPKFGFGRVNAGRAVAMAVAAKKAKAKKPKAKSRKPKTTPKKK